MRTCYIVWHYTCWSRIDLTRYKSDTIHHIESVYLNSVIQRSPNFGLNAKSNSHLWNQPPVQISFHREKWGNRPRLKRLHNVFTGWPSSVFIFVFSFVIELCVWVWVCICTCICKNTRRNCPCLKRLHNVYTGWMSSVFVFVFAFVKNKAKCSVWKGYTTIFTLGGCRRCGEQKEVRRLHWESWEGLERGADFFGDLRIPNLFLNFSEFKTVKLFSILRRKTFNCFQLLAESTTLLLVPRGLASTRSGNPDFGQK